MATWHENPALYFGINPNTYNAKNLPYDQPGVGAANAGVGRDNVLATMQRLYGERAQKGGGSKSIYDAALKWATNNGRPDVASALKTGNFAGVNPDSLLDAYDHGYRETTRAQQNKGGGLLSAIGKLVKGALPAVAGSLVLGPAGAGLVSAGAGGAIGGGVAGLAKDGIKGGLIGGLTGYGVGSGVGAAQNWLQGGAPLANVNALMPADIAARAGTSAAGGAGALAGSAGTAASAGGSVLDRLLDNAPAIAGAATLLGSGSGGSGGSQIDLSGGAERLRQAERDRGAEAVDQAFANQDDYYNRLRSSVFDYQSRNLDRDYGDQSRELKFELARRGHLGGSQEIDSRGDLRELYDEGRLAAGSVADDAARRAKLADQSARAQAIQDIYLDVDSSQAVGNAIQQSAIAREQAADYGKGQDLGDVFSKFAYLYQQGQGRNERQRAARDYYGGSPVAVGAASSNYGRTS